MCVLGCAPPVVPLIFLPPVGAEPPRAPPLPRIHSLTLIFSQAHSFTSEGVDAPDLTNSSLHFFFRVPSEHQLGRGTKHMPWFFFLLQAQFFNHSAMAPDPPHLHTTANCSSQAVRVAAASKEGVGHFRLFCKLLHGNVPLSVTTTKRDSAWIWAGEKQHPTKKQVFQGSLLSECVFVGSGPFLCVSSFVSLFGGVCVHGRG